MRIRLVAPVSALVILLLFLAWHFRSRKGAAEPSASSPSTSGAMLVVTPASPATSESAPTKIYAHNLMLRKGPNFRIYVRWLRGQMLRTSPDVIPSFDDPEHSAQEHKSLGRRRSDQDPRKFPQGRLPAD